MDRISRKTFQSRLIDDWQNYVERYNGLTTAEQQAFLEKQGYARLGDLLGHVIAWWQDGAQTIAQMRADASYPLGDYDVDGFNARAVDSIKIGSVILIANFLVHKRRNVACSRAPEARIRRIKIKKKAVHGGV